jgi:hypothetical protein
MENLGCDTVGEFLFWLDFEFKNYTNYSSFLQIVSNFMGYLSVPDLSHFLIEQGLKLC